MPKNNEERGQDIMDDFVYFIIAAVVAALHIVVYSFEKISKTT